MSHISSRSQFRRFGFRTLLAFITLVALLFAYLGSMRHQYWFEQEVGRAVKAVGGEFREGYFPPFWLPEQEVEEKWFHRLKTVDLRAAQDLDDSFALKFGKLSHLEQASLYRTAFSDEALKQLARVSTLKVLNIEDTAVTDQGLSSVTRMRNLAILSFGSPTITDTGLQHLTGLKNLKQLRLRNSRVTDAGLRHLQGLENLASLRLAGLNLRGPGLAHLTNPSGGIVHGRKGQFHLSLDGCKIDNAGAKGLSHLTAITGLNLSDNPFGDDGLVHLAPLKKLERLWLANTTVTRNGLRYLQSLTQLTELEVSLTDDDVDALEGFRNLRWLRVRGITDAGLVRLPELPNLRELLLSSAYDGGVEIDVTDEGIKRIRKLRPGLSASRVPASWIPWGGM
jgi:hypothetical protein